MITGWLAGRELFFAAFVTAGTLKASYDLGLLAIFVNHKPRKEDEEEREE